MGVNQIKYHANLSCTINLYVGRCLNSLEETHMFSLKIDSTITKLFTLQPSTEKKWEKEHSLFWHPKVHDRHCHWPRQNMCSSLLCPWTNGRATELLKGSLRFPFPSVLCSPAALARLVAPCLRSDHTKKLDTSMSRSSRNPLPSALSIADMTSSNPNCTSPPATSKGGKETTWLESEVAGDTAQLSDVDGAEKGLRSGTRHPLAVAGVEEKQKGAGASQPCSSCCYGSTAGPSAFTYRQAGAQALQEAAGARVGPCLDAKKFGKMHCSGFRCYLAISV